MKLKDANLCLDCEEVFDRTNIHACPACGNRHNLYLAPILDRKEDLKHEISTLCSNSGSKGGSKT